MNNQSYPRLPKWPFLLGDLFFVGLAILLAVFSSKPYDAIAASSIILSGVLAVLFFAAPFIVEYFSRLQVANSLFQESVDEQAKQTRNVIDELQTVTRTLSELAQKSASSAEQLKEIGPVLHEKIADLESAVEKSVKEQKSELSENLKTLREAQTKELESFSSQLKEVREEVEDLFDKARSASQDSDSGLERLGEKLDVLLDSLGEGTPKDETASSGERPTPDLGESKKAVKIEGKKQPEREKSEPVHEQAGLWPEPPEIDPEAVEDNTTEVVVENPDVEFEEEEIPAPVPAQGSPEPSKGPSADPASLTLIAHTNIGLGNTPYVRGEGPGLNWTEGVPMSFLEIGKWEWTVENAGEAANVRVFKNDEISAYGDDVEIGIGELVEIYPDFPEAEA